MQLKAVVNQADIIVNCAAYTNVDGAESDQQKFEILYDGADPQRFIGGDDKRIIKARMRFNWDGLPPEGETSAPSFMLIDYFTLHLKW